MSPDTLIDYPTIDDRLAAPPDRHAERVVDEMISWLHKAAPHMRGDGAVIDPVRMGGPRGQRRTMERVKDALGALLLACYLSTGKRGRFKMALTFWHLWDPSHNEVVMPGEAVPHGAGLVAVLVLLEGPGYEPNWTILPVFVCSRHACVRLAQRAGVRTCADLILAMRDLWHAAEPLIGECGPGGEQRPLRPDCPDSPVAVFEPHRIFKRKLLVVKTVLATKMAHAAVEKEDA